jgi:hypothetical protein
VNRTTEAIARDLAALIKRANDLLRGSAELRRAAKELAEGRAPQGGLGETEAALPSSVLCRPGRRRNEGGASESGASGATGGVSVLAARHPCQLASGQLASTECQLRLEGWPSRALAHKGTHEAAEASEALEMISSLVLSECVPATPSILGVQKRHQHNGSALSELYCSAQLCTG